MEAVAERRPALLDIAWFWVLVGAYSWGGMYAVLPKIKGQLNDRGWVSDDEFDALMAVATLVPGPSFVSLSGLVGHKLRGAAGSLVAMLSLMLPPTALVAAALIFVSSGLNSGPMAEITRIMTIAMAGVILGNAWRIMRGARFRVAGLILLVLTAAAIFAGIPVVWVVIGALVLSRLMLRGDVK